MVIDQLHGHLSMSICVRIYADLCDDAMPKTQFSDPHNLQL